MKECIRNKRGYWQKKAAKSAGKASETFDLDRIKHYMDQEMQNSEPSTSALKGLLFQCRQRRVEDAKTCSPLEHMTNYPALKIPSLVRNTFLPFG